MGRTLSNKEFVEKIQKIHPNITLLSEYKGCHERVDCKCDICGYYWKPTPRYLLRGSGCKICSQKRANEKKVKNPVLYEQELIAKFPNIHLITPYNCAKDKVQYHCDICNSNGELKASILLRKGCSFCREIKFKDGMRSYDNSIATKRPDLLIYLKNPSDSKYLCQSGKIIPMVCPNCHTETMKIISNVVKQGFSCPVCSDKISYPNKLIRALMSQIHTDYICYEYSPEWLKPMRFDCYFEINSKKYAIEMDGRWHFTDNHLSGQTMQETQKIDKYKVEVAKNHSVQVIHIDCYYSNFEYIKNNILHSSLSAIIDLTNIDWERCDKDSRSKLIKNVCEYYNQHQEMSGKEIGDVFHLSICTIRRYLKIGDKLHWCIYDKEKFKQIGVEKSAQAKWKPIDVYNENNELLYHFNSIKECCSFMTNQYNMSFRYSPIRESCKTNKALKGFYFKLSNKE